MDSKYKSRALIEKAELERLHQRQIKEYDPTLRSLAQIQDQIVKLFDDPQLSDDGKCKILAHLHERYAGLLSQYKRSAAPLAHIPSIKATHVPINKVIFQSSEDEATVDEDGEDTLTSQDPPQIPNLSDANIPAHFGKKYEQFQNFLRDHQNEISTNDRKEIVLDGEAIAYSSFPDLLRSLYVRNQDLNLIGVQQFHRRLHSLNARLDMFSNRETLNSLTHLNKKSQNQTQSGSGPRPPVKRTRILYVFR